MINNKPAVNRSPFRSQCLQECLTTGQFKGASYSNTSGDDRRSNEDPRIGGCVYRGVARGGKIQGQSGCLSTKNDHYWPGSRAGQMFNLDIDGDARFFFWSELAR